MSQLNENPRKNLQDEALKAAAVGTVPLVFCWGFALTIPHILKYGFSDPDTNFVFGGSVFAGAIAVVAFITALALFLASLRYPKEENQSKENDTGVEPKMLINS
jgi:hypothetical protein